MNCTGENCTISIPAAPPSYNLASGVITIAICVVGVWMNIIVIVAIVCQKKMHTPCFILIAGSAFGSMLLDIYYIISNSAKIGEYNGLWSLSKRTKIACLFIQFYIVGMSAVSLNVLTVLLVAMDRLFSSVSPVRYRQAGKKYALVGLALCGCYSIAEILVMLFAGPSLDAIIPTCRDLPSVLGKEIFAGVARTNLAASILSVITYIGMFLCVHLKKSKIDNNSENGGFATAVEKQIFFRQQAAILPAAKLLLVLYVITGIVPELIYNVAPVFSVWLDVAGHLKTSSSFVEMISLTLRCKLFRNSVRRLFRLNHTGGVVSQTA